MDYINDQMYFDIDLILLNIFSHEGYVDKKYIYGTRLNS
jgi:hypothetical protein